MQTTVVFIEEPCPSFIFELPTEAYFLISIVVLTLFHAFRYSRITKPPVQPIPSKARSDSLISNTSTLVDAVEADAAAKSTPEDASNIKKEKELHRHFSFSAKTSNPFNHIGPLFQEAGKSTARRISMPIRRLSSSVAHAVHHLTPLHIHIHDEADSYSIGKKSAEAEVVKDDKDKAINNDTTLVDDSKSTIVTASAISEQATVAVPEAKVVVQNEDESPIDDSAAPKKPSAFKRVTRRASIVLHINHPHS